MVANVSLGSVRLLHVWVSNSDISTLYQSGGTRVEAETSYPQPLCEIIESELFYCAVSEAPCRGCSNS